jgi:hypothetical protein
MTFGNIYVLGSSQNSHAQMGYATLKYASNGNQLWAARYDSTTNPSATPSGLALDSNNNAVVTGSALTIKYNSAGNQLWTAPYDGTALAVDSQERVVVTGFASGFKTVKLSSAGANLWAAAYVEPKGPALSQWVLPDGNGNTYVIGPDTYFCFPGFCYQQALIVKYDQDGNQLWAGGDSQDIGPFDGVQIAGAALDSAGNVYVIINTQGPKFLTSKFSSNGSPIWTSTDFRANNTANGLALDHAAQSFVVGGISEDGREMLAEPPN